MSKIQPSLEEDEEYLLDEVKGIKSKRKLAVLNKNKISKYEMDELFMSEDYKK